MISKASFLGVFLLGVLWLPSKAHAACSDRTVNFTNSTNFNENVTLGYKRCVNGYLSLWGTISNFTSGTQSPIPAIHSISGVPTKTLYVRMDHAFTIIKADGTSDSSTQISNSTDHIYYVPLTNCSSTVTHTIKSSTTDQTTDVPYLELGGCSE